MCLRDSPRSTLRTLPWLLLGALVSDPLALTSCNPGPKKEVLAVGADRKEMPWARQPGVKPGQESLNGRWERVDRGWGFKKNTFVVIRDGVLLQVGKDSMELGSVLRSLSLTQGGLVDLYVNDWRKQPGMYGFQWKDGEKDGRFYAYAVIGVVATDKKLYLVFSILERKKKGDAPIETQRAWVCERRS